MRVERWSQAVTACLGAKVGEHSIRAPAATSRDRVVVCSGTDQGGSATRSDAFNGEKAGSHTSGGLDLGGAKLESGGQPVQNGE